jgi:DNA phosphorothioation-associated putative methyltransferase
MDPTQTVFDYGCGQGLDMHYLRDRGFKVGGWDPNWLPDGEINPADVVLLNFVVDCIADPGERVEALQRAWALAGDYMMVRVRRDRSLRRLTRYSDGWLTQWRTFQRLFTQGEFYQFLKGSLPDTEPMEFERGGCALMAKTDYWQRRIERHSHWIRSVGIHGKGSA